mgnify:CR=1 FL=1
MNPDIPCTNPCGCAPRPKPKLQLWAKIIIGISVSIVITVILILFTLVVWIIVRRLPETVILTQNYKEGGTPTSGQSSNQVLLVVVVLADFIILGP